MVESKQPTLLTTAQVIPPEAFLYLYLALKVLMDPSQLHPITSIIGTPQTTPVGWMHLLCWAEPRGWCCLGQSKCVHRVACNRPAYALGHGERKVRGAGQRRVWFSLPQILSLLVCPVSHRAAVS